MKNRRSLALLLGLMSALLFGCTPRTPPQQPPAEQEQPSDETQLPDAPQDAQPPSEKEQGDKDEDEEQPPANKARAGTFLLMDSQYEITIQEPFVGIHDEGLGGFYISAPDDGTVQGIVSYTKGEYEVKEIEDSIANLNAALKNDPSVYDFAFDRQKEPNGLYHITFTYGTKADEVSTAGFQYVYYQRTPDGMLTVMFNCPTKDYTNDILKVFRSVVPATDKAEQPAERASSGN